MFKLFGVSGSACPRCDHVNQEASNYCTECGMTLGAPQPILRDNRWCPADNEMAVFFGIKQLSGLFRKVLVVPPAARAYILQADKATQVPQGEYELESFFSRLNHLLRDQPAEILITRQAPFTLLFTMQGIHSAEYLKLDADFTLSIQIEAVSAFAQHFMQIPGCITTEQIQALLQPLLRQVLAEFIGAQTLHEMTRNPLLREQLNERLHSALKLRLAHFGLAILQVETVQLQHEKWHQNREREGVLALILDAKRVELNHTRELAGLYSEQQWKQITENEQQQQQQLRRAQLGREQRLEKANLILEEREQLQALRAREIELYGRIVEAQNRKQAIERGAQVALQKLELDLQQQAGERKAQALEWEQVRALAQIKLRTELELAQLAGKETILLEQQHAAQLLQQWQGQQQLAHIEQIGNEQIRRAEMARLRLAQEQQYQHEQQLQAQMQQARLQGFALEREARANEAQRILNWENEVARQRQRELLRSDEVRDTEHQLQVQAIEQKILDLQRLGGQADAVAQQEKLLRTIDAQAALAQQERSAKKALRQDELDAEERLSILREQAQEAEWQRRLKLEEQNHQQRLARFAALNEVSDFSKVALADLPNAALLADILKTQLQAGMSAEQIKAGQGKAASEAVAQAVQEEREWQNERSRQERDHVLAMLQVSRTGQIAPAPMPVLPVLPAQTVLSIRTCHIGHVNLPAAKFCTECGAPLV